MDKDFEDMTNKEKVQEQFELFSKPQDLAQTKRILNRTSPNLNILVSADNLIVISIGIILALIFAFSLGVEKGKKVALNVPGKDITTEKIKQVKEIPKPPESKSQEPKPEKVEKVEKPVEPKEEFKDGYTVQVASFKKSSSIEKEAQKLKKAGYNTVVQPKGRYLTLCVGNFENKTQARNSQKKLKQKYHDCYVRRL